MSGPESSIVLYQADDGQTRIECRFENESIWLSQALMAELFTDNQSIFTIGR